MRSDPRRLVDDFVRDEIAADRCLGAQVYVSVAGNAVIDVARGESRRGTGMTQESILRWLCCSKPLTAMLLGILAERGLLSFDDDICQYVPEVRADHGTITLRHLLTHTAGFANDAACDMWKDAEKLRTELASTPVASPPGEEAFYTSGVAWQALGLAVERVLDEPYDVVVRREIFEPLGMTRSWVAMSPAQHRAYGREIGILYDARGPNLVPLIAWEDPACCDRVLPGLSARGPARELARVFECLQSRGRTPSGEPLLAATTVDELLAVHRRGLPDRAFGSGSLAVEWGLGVIPDPRWWPGVPSPADVAGHTGLGTSFVLLDRTNDVVVAGIFNGMISERDDVRRRGGLIAAAYLELGLSNGPSDLTVDAISREYD